jgi:hypothetical protein
MIAYNNSTASTATYIDDPYSTAATYTDNNYVTTTLYIVPADLYIEDDPYKDLPIPVKPKITYNHKVQRKEPSVTHYLPVFNFYRKVLPCNRKGIGLRIKNRK